MYFNAISIICYSIHIDELRFVNNILLIRFQLKCVVILRSPQVNYIYNLLRSDKNALVHVFFVSSHGVNSSWVYLKRLNVFWKLISLTDILYLYIPIISEVKLLDYAVARSSTLL